MRVWCLFENSNNNKLQVRVSKEKLPLLFDILEYWSASASVFHLQNGNVQCSFKYLPLKVIYKRLAVYFSRQKYLSCNASFTNILSTFFLSGLIFFLFLLSLSFYPSLLVTHVTSHVAVSKHCHSLHLLFSIPSDLTLIACHNPMLGLLRSAIPGVCASGEAQMSILDITDKTIS